MGNTILELSTETLKAGSSMMASGREIPQAQGYVMVPCQLLKDTLLQAAFMWIQNTCKIVYIVIKHWLWNGDN